MSKRKVQDHFLFHSNLTLLHEWNLKVKKKQCFFVALTKHASSQEPDNQSDKKKKKQLN